MKKTPLDNLVAINSPQQSHSNNT